MRRPVIPLVLVRSVKIVTLIDQQNTLMCTQQTITALKSVKTIMLLRAKYNAV